jgi:hypothetical protein
MSLKDRFTDEVTSIDEPTTNIMESYRFNDNLGDEGRRILSFYVRYRIKRRIKIGYRFGEICVDDRLFGGSRSIG